MTNRKVACRVPNVAAGISRAVKDRLREGLTVELLQQQLDQTWLRIHGRKMPIDLVLLGITGQVAYMRTCRYYSSRHLQLAQAQTCSEAFDLFSCVANACKFAFSTSSFTFVIRGFLRNSCL
jgi:hypothetical protein